MSLLAEGTPVGWKVISEQAIAMKSSPRRSQNAMDLIEQLAPFDGQLVALCCALYFICLFVFCSCVGLRNTKLIEFLVNMQTGFSQSKTDG